MPSSLSAAGGIRTLSFSLRLFQGLRAQLATLWSGTPCTLSHIASYLLYGCTVISSISVHLVISSPAKISSIHWPTLFPEPSSCPPVDLGERWLTELTRGSSRTFLRYRKPCWRVWDIAFCFPVPPLPTRFSYTNPAVALPIQPLPVLLSCLDDHSRFSPSLVP